MRKTAITALMPVKHYHPVFLRRAVASIITQRDPRWELLIIVEKFDLDSFSRILEEALADQRIQMLVNQGRRLAGAINTGMQFARTDFVTLLFADDMWSHDAVNVLSGYIAQYPDIDFFHSSRVIIGEKAQPISPVFYSRKEVRLGDFVVELPVKHLLCWRRNNALSIGGLDESLNSVGPDDYDFPWTMAEHGATFKAVTECLYYYRDHRESYRLTTHLPLSVHKREIRRMMKKHGAGILSTCRYVFRAKRSYLRQCLYRSTLDKWIKEHLGYEPRRGWRETYTHDSSTME